MRKRELIAEYRAAKKAADEQAYDDGASAGREWATTDPVPYTELSTLADNRPILKNFEDIDYVTELILGSDVDDGYMVVDFWENAVGDDWSRIVFNPQFLRGFCEGALQVWAEVEPHLV